jgi:UDP-N-acetylmuramoyl-tripeptide--D-alanyl-D-alanine ligase
VLTFGAQEGAVGADAQLLKFDGQDNFSRISARVLGEELNFILGAPGRHLAINALAVLLAARSVGLDLATASASLALFASQQGRGARERLRLDRQAPESEFLLIDESYNANPASMEAAIDVLGAAKPGSNGRRIAVLGDMLELGPAAADLHVGLGEGLLRNGVDLVFAAGPLTRHLFDSLPEQKRGGWAESAARLEPQLVEALAPGDIVMVKGSNGSRMHALVAGLKARFGAREKLKIED